MIIEAFKKAEQRAKEKSWDKIYVAVDIHGTIINPSYILNDVSVLWYNGAIRCLQIMSEDPSICLILFTSSTPSQISEYQKIFKRRGINFEYINKNPEVSSTEGIGYFKDKFYFNVLIDDKAGFNPEIEWEQLLNYL